MKNLITNFWNNIDNDQKAIVKSVAVISTIVLGLSTLDNIIAMFIPIIQFITTLCFSNTSKRFFVDKGTEYRFDTFSKKKFKKTTPLYFLISGWALYFVALYFMLFNLEEHFLGAVVLLIPTLITRGVAFKMKLPLSVLLFLSLGDGYDGSAHTGSSQFDSSARSSFPEMGDAVQDPAFSSSPSNIYHTPTHRQD